MFAFPAHSHPRKVASLLGFLRFAFQKSEQISSRARYDRFDTSPFNNYLVFGANNMISSAAPSTTRTTLHLYKSTGFPVIGK